ncbi:MAG: InlB B-repeat-containing protein [Aeriscardovia sp.]|nr:InlB B-repeat-containing protein [Aeriscardovia sp.]
MHFLKTVHLTDVIFIIISFVIALIFVPSSYADTSTSQVNISSVGTAKIISIADSSGNIFTGINTDGTTVGTKNPNGDEPDHLSIQITFNSNDLFTPGEQIVIPLLNGAHQPLYQYSISTPQYVTFEGQKIFQASSTIEGELDEDTAYPEIILTALPAVAGMHNITSTTLECAGSLMRANILSDLTGSTKSTITTDGNTYTITNKPFNLSACFQNSGYARAFNLTHSQAGQASMTVGYDARCIINWALDQNKVQYNNPVNLDIPIIVWQHITSNSPFTINHNQTGIQGVVDWVSTTTPFSQGSSAAGFISGKQAYSSINTSYTTGTGIESYAAAQATLKNSVGKTIIESDGDGGYYIASNIGAPGNQPSNDLDSKQPNAQNNTGMSSIVTQLKQLGLDYPSRWSQNVQIQFTDNPEVQQSAVSQWQIGPAYTTTSTGSCTNNYWYGQQICSTQTQTGVIAQPSGTLSGTTTISSQNVLGETSGILYAALNYDANGGTGTMNADIEPVGTQVSIAQNGFTRPGYTFTGWNTKPQGDGTAYQPGNTLDLPKGSMTVYAQWKKNPDEQVIYEGNGATSGSTATQTQVEGLTVNLSQNGFTRPGYTFTGWNTEADGSGTSYQPGTVYTVPGHTTYLYAQWKPDQGTISYNANGGTGTTASQTGNVDSSTSVAQNGFTRPGYTFTGWNTEADGSGTSYQPGTSITIPNGTKVLYAQWKLIPIRDLPLTGSNEAIHHQHIILWASAITVICGTLIFSLIKKKHTIND